MSAVKSAREPSIASLPRFSFRATWRAEIPQCHNRHGRKVRSTHPRYTRVMKLRSILILLLVMSAVLAAGAYQAIKWAQGPVVPPSEHPPSKDVLIPDGATFKHIAALLERDGLIKSQFA